KPLVPAVDQAIGHADLAIAIVRRDEELASAADARDDGIRQRRTQQIAFLRGRREPGTAERNAIERPQVLDLAATDVPASGAREIERAAPVERERGGRRDPAALARAAGLEALPAHVDLRRECRRPLQLAVAEERTAEQTTDRQWGR